jgi:hypothetical protein
MWYVCVSVCSRSLSVSLVPLAHSSPVVVRRYMRQLITEPGKHTQTTQGKKRQAGMRGIIDSFQGRGRLRCPAPPSLPFPSLPFLLCRQPCHGCLVRLPSFS